MSFEGTDGIIAVAAGLGPIDAVVAHSAGCGMVAAAIGEGCRVDRGAFIAPPLAEGNRWLRYAEKLGVSEDVALAAKAMYYDAHGPERATWNARTAYSTLDVDLLIVQSRDDERNAFENAEVVIPTNPRATLVLVDGPTHRRTARDPDVVRLVADFVSA